MKINQILLVLAILLMASLAVPISLKAQVTEVAQTEGVSIFERIRTQIEYFLAFSDESKVEVLDKQAQRRLDDAQKKASSGDSQQVSQQLNNYLQIKEQQDNLIQDLPEVNKVLERVQERTLEQQQTMEQIKNMGDENMIREVVQVQEQVVNQVAKNIVEVNGKQGQTEFFENVKHVWAAGTRPGGEAGVVIEGGAMQFAPGTSAGGPAKSDIKTVEIKTGGTVNDPVPVQNGPNYAPGTSGGGNAGADIKTVEIKGN